MNKEQFLAQLSQRLDVLPAQDVQRMKEFFSETIDDRVESGMTEAEAVAALGDPDQIIQEILQENGGLPVAREAQTESDESSVRLREPIRAVRVETRFTNVMLQCGTLAPGETVAFEGPEGLRWSVSDGVLHIVCDDETAREESFSLGSALKNIVHGTIGSFFCTDDDTLVLTLPENAASDVCLRTVSGDVRAESASLRGNLEIATTSGNAICLRTAAASFSFQTTSGDAELTESIFSGTLSIQTISGDMRLSQLRADSLSLQTTSGDMQILCVESERGLTVGSVSGDLILDGLNLVDALACRTVSGDLRLLNLSVENLQASTASGDIALSCAQIRVHCALTTQSGDVSLDTAEAAAFEISSKSGDVRGSLAGESSRYDFRCVSQSGAVRVPFDRGERPVQVRTASGDITLRCEA